MAFTAGMCERCGRWRHRRGARRPGLAAAVAAALALSGLAGCSRSEGAARILAAACPVLDRQVADAAHAPVDLIGMDRSGIDGLLTRRERGLQELAASDPLDRSMFRDEAGLVGQARPLVVARWGDRDGSVLQERAVRAGLFDFVAEALDEDGRHADAQRLGRLVSERNWRTFRLATRCHPTPEVPTRKLSSLGERPPVPLLALDISVGGSLWRVTPAGSQPVGPKGLRLHFPHLSSDGATIIAPTVTGPGQQSHVRTVAAASGTAERDFGPAWFCGGWLPDGTAVLGRLDGAKATFEAADQPGRPLPLGDGDCPVPGPRPGEVVVTEGQRGREDSWITARQVAGGTVTHEYRQPGCNLAGPAADSSSTRVVVAATCRNPLDDGLWTAGGDTGTLRHVLTCVCGVPTFSPDGEWIAYTIAPTGGTGAYDVRLGFAHSDGTAAFHLPEGRLSFPLWPPAQR